MSVQVLAETHPVARKRHLCQHCRGNIPAGRPYLNVRCAEDGTVWTFKAHELCDLVYWKSRHATGELDSEDWYDFWDVTDGHEPECKAAIYPHDGPCVCGRRSSDA